MSRPPVPVLLTAIVPVVAFAGGWMFGGLPLSAQKSDPPARARPAPKKPADPKADAPKDKAKDSREVPKEGSLYLYQIPEAGLQTLLVLKVTGGNTFEGAYLVPVRVRIDGVVDDAKPDAVEKLIGGRLVNTYMKGRDKDGFVLADVHFGAQKKDAPNDPYGWISDWMKKK